MPQPRGSDRLAGQNLDNAVLLVTGANGLIGQALMRYAAPRCSRIVAVDLRFGPRSRQLAKAYPIELVQADVRQPQGLINLASRVRPDAIVHLAALLDVDGVLAPRQHVEVNILGALAVFECASSLDCKCIYISSRGVFASRRSGLIPEPTVETTPIDPSVSRGMYSACKWFVEKTAEYYRRNKGLDVVGLRLASTFGVGKSAVTHGNQSAVDDMVRAAVTKTAYSITGGDQSNDFLYCGNVAHAIALLAGAKVPRAVYNIGSGGLMTLREVAEVVKDVAPDADITVTPGEDYLGSAGYGYCQMDCSSAQADFGYSPVYSIHDAISEYVQLLTEEEDG